jgi:hypothetical protein
VDILDLLDSAFFVPCVMLLFLSPSIWEMRVVWYDNGCGVVHRDADVVWVYEHKRTSDM